MQEWSHNNEMERHAVKRFVHSIKTRSGPHYNVRFNGYNFVDDIVETPAHLQKQFVEAYLHRKQQQSSGTKQMEIEKTRF